eukprot:ctg_441.g245
MSLAQIRALREIRESQRAGQEPGAATVDLFIISAKALAAGLQNTSPGRSRTASTCHKEYPHPLCLSSTLIRPERALAQADIP